MSDYNAERIEKPEYFGIRPLKQGRGKRKPYVIGFDTEADQSKPFLMQFALPDQTEDEVYAIEVPDEHLAGLRYFVRFIEEHCTRKDTEYLIYGWNLQYEYTQLFHDFDEQLRDQGEIGFDVINDETGTEWDFRVTNEKRFYVVMTNKSTHRQIRFLDGMAYFKTSLDNAAKMLGLGEKYSSDTIDRARFTRASLTDPEFLTYARRDALITRKVGEYIVKMHEDYDVTLCISAPHFASKVFKHSFLDGEIELPHPELEQYGLWSYHGGKNGFYIPNPKRIVRAFQYDITSAYPEAMRQLPDPVHSQWDEVHRYEPGRHGIYRVTLEYKRCPYRGLINVNGTWPQGGYIEDAFITSYELDAMVDLGECRIKSIHGYEMVGPSGGALVNYVDTFFGMKAKATGPERETAKLFLNSLYGKFFQKIPLGMVTGFYAPDLMDPSTWEIVETDPDQPFDWRAGGLYHPPIASLITGFVRGRIHRLEHKYHSLMTSTDGIFGLESPDANDLGKHLGGLTVATGDLKLWRERLYIFRPDDGDKPKIALHGFRADADVLDTIPLEHGTYRYTGRQMVTLKLSTRALDGTKYAPGTFVDLPYEITI